MGLPPPYKGKPTVYLDQNILDLMIKHDVGAFRQTLSTDYQVVYSNETLKEIKRSKGFEDKFLNVLQNLNAYHLKLEVKTPSFTITNNTILTDENPFKIFEEYSDDNLVETESEQAMQQWLFKFSGGRKGESIEAIHSEQIEAYSNLMNYMQEIATSLSKEVQIRVDDFTKIMKLQYQTKLDELEKTMLKNIPDYENWDGIKDFRNHFKLGPKELNNIVPPCILVKIWEMFKNTTDFKQKEVDIDDFFNLKVNPVYPDKPYYKYQKVTSIYNMLNTIGYYPDSKIHKERRFIAALSDNNHASMASFCDELLSIDKSFIKKSEAAYEYLEISTIARHVVVNHV